MSEESHPVVCSLIRVPGPSQRAEAAVALRAGAADLPAGEVVGAVELSLSSRPPPLTEVLRTVLAVLSPSSPSTTSPGPLLVVPELVEAAVLSEGVVTVGVCRRSRRRTG